MKKSFWILGILVLAVSMSACSSKERSTASHDDEYKAHRPLTGETRR